jgi:hypothetical protein
MFETTVDCGWGTFLAVIYLVTKFCSYKSDFDLDIVQRFLNGKKKWYFERKKEKFPDMYNRF